MGFCSRVVLHRCAILYPRVHHAEIPPANGTALRVEYQGETVSFYGTDVYSYLFFVHWTLGPLRDESDSDVVF